MRRFELRPRRRLGQNFLVDRRVAERIAQAAGAGPEDRVLEVGAGLGALTLALARSGADVVAVERDPRLAEALRWVLARLHRPPRAGQAVYVVVGDILELDLGRLVSGPAGGGLVAANLPYVISSPFLLRLAPAPGWRRAVLMLQREVADRLLAGPGSAAYGSLTVAVGARMQVRRLFEVSRRAFWPVPEVDSTVVELMPRPRRLPEAVDRALEVVLRASFGQRRKTLKNALTGWLALERDEGRKGRAGALSDRKEAAAWVEGVLRAAGLNPEQRGESLSVEEFVRLAEVWAGWQELLR